MTVDTVVQSASPAMQTAAPVVEAEQRPTPLTPSSTCLFRTLRSCLSSNRLQPHIRGTLRVRMSGVSSLAARYPDRLRDVHELAHLGRRSEGATLRRGRWRN